jgi:hypothetical protein
MESDGCNRRSDSFSNGVPLVLTVIEHHSRVSQLLSDFGLSGGMLGDVC